MGLGPNVLCLTNSCFRWGNGIQRMTRSLHRWYNSHRSVDEEHMKVRINPAHCAERVAHGCRSDKVSDSQIGRHGSDKWCPGKTIWELTTCGVSPWRKWDAEKIVCAGPWKLRVEIWWIDLVYIPVSLHSVHRWGLALRGSGTNAPWWIYSVVPTRCMWICSWIKEILSVSWFCLI